MKIFLKFLYFTCVPYVPGTNVVYVPAWFTCQRATSQKRANLSFLRANVSINLSRYHTACQCFNLAGQRAKWRANFSTWHANVLKGVPIFQAFLLRNAKWNFYTLLLYRKCYILHNIICICVVNKNCIILHLHTSCHIKEKCVDFFFFIIFFSFLLFSYKLKYRKTLFLYVTSNKGFLVWIFWSSWIVICLSWRSHIATRKLIVTMFLSVSSVYVFEYCSA